MWTYVRDDRPFGGPAPPAALRETTMDPARRTLLKVVALPEDRAATSELVESLMGRQKWKKSFQYEVKWVGMLPKHNSQGSRETLLEWGFSKQVRILFLFEGRKRP